MGDLWTPGDDEPISAGPPTDDQRLAEELAAMQAELAQTPASVVVANHAVGLFQLAAIHLNQRPPNLTEGQLAIDAMAALIDGVGGRLGEEEDALREGLAQLRMAFVTLSTSLKE